MIKKNNNKIIKILYLIDNLSVGGTEKQLILLVEALDRNQYIPYIGILEDHEYHNNLNINTKIIKFLSNGYPLIKNFLVILRIRQFIKKEKISIVQTQFSTSTIYVAIATFLCKNKPIFLSTRRNLYHWIKDEPIIFKLVRFTNRWTDKILLNSYAALEKCKELEQIRPQKAVVIQNMVEVEKYSEFQSGWAKQNLELTEQFPIIGVVANFRPVKGLTYFLRAAALVKEKFPSAHFVLVGSGPQKDELECLAKTLGIFSSVKFMENDYDSSKILPVFDIAVQPSLSESFSNVLIEYMASKKSIVASNVGDAGKIIENEREGLIVNPGDHDSLSKAIIKLLHNKEEAEKMAKNAYIKVKRNWSLYKILGEYNEFYLDLMSDKI